MSTSLDPALDLARRAAQDEAGPDAVGDHVESVVEDDGVRTHYFECRSRGYVGWRWAVTVAELADEPTVSEVVLLPGDAAVLAPTWVPWQERVRPGDLGPGDLYPTAPEDPRLEPGYTGSDALEAVDEPTGDLAPLRPEQWELGLGRERVLSAYGRDLATERWSDGDFGADSAMAKAAPASCGSCGFLLPIGGLVGQAFGVCAHEMGADGRVVALGYGCGAHSSVREIEGTGVPVTEMAVDELAYETVDTSTEAGTDAVIGASLLIGTDAVTDTDSDITAELADADEPVEPAGAEEAGPDAAGDTGAVEHEVDRARAGTDEEPGSAETPDSADSADSAASADEDADDEDDDIVDIEPDEVLG